MSEQPTPEGVTIKRDKLCADCGGYDIEWMYKCFDHGTEYCRGCSCPICSEEAYDDDCYEGDDDE